MLDDKVAVTLTRADWQQILDGLRARKQAWDNTVLFFQDSLDITAPIEDVKDEAEAVLIRDHYRDIIVSIESQIREN